MYLKVFASLGHWNTAVYVVLALHFVPVWLVGSYHQFHHLYYRYIYLITKMMFFRAWVWAKHDKTRGLFKIYSSFRNKKDETRDMLKKI